MYSRFFSIKYKEMCSDFEYCDCFGLVKLLYAHEHGLFLPDYHERFAKITPGSTRAVIREGRWEKINRIVLPSVTLIALGREVDHIAYNIDRFRFLHIRRAAGKPELNRIYDLQYRNRIKGFYRYVEQ